MQKAKKSPSDEVSEPSDANTIALLASGYLLKLERFCAYQDRCRYEVKQKMRALDVPNDLWHKLISYLEYEGFLNESRFSMVFARSKFNIKGWGPMKIKLELQKRQIEPELISLALEQFGSEDRGEKLLAILQKYIRTVKFSSEYELRAKLCRHAMSKGYAYSEANKVVDVVLKNS